MPNISKADWQAVQDEQKRLNDRVKELEELILIDDGEISNKFREIIIAEEFGYSFDHVKEMTIHALKQCVHNQLVNMEEDNEHLQREIHTRDNMIEELNAIIQPLRDKIVEMVMKGGM